MIPFQLLNKYTFLIHSDVLLKCKINQQSTTPLNMIDTAATIEKLPAKLQFVLHIEIIHHFHHV